MLPVVGFTQNLHRIVILYCCPLFKKFIEAFTFCNFFCPFSVFLNNKGCRKEEGTTNYTNKWSDVEGIS